MDEQNIATKFSQISSYLNEKTLRIWAAVEALSFPRGGISMVAKATGMSRSTIHIGILEIQPSKENSLLIEIERTRRKGGGRSKTVVENNRNQWGQKPMGSAETNGVRVD